MNPKQKLERVAGDYLLSVGISIPVYKGIENIVAIDDSLDDQPEKQIRPCARVSVESDLTEAIPFTANWEGDLTVSVEADSQNTTDATFDRLSDSVFSHFNWSDLSTKLNTAGRFYGEAFTCLFSNLEAPSGRFTQGNNWVNSQRIHIVFCESNL